jgi:hypothetical protein
MTLNLDREHLAAKIALDIVQYTSVNRQAKLSLLQDLIINLLPYSEKGNSLYHKLQIVRCHKSSENVTDWLDALLKLYIEDSHVKQCISELTDEQKNEPY